MSNLLVVRGIPGAGKSYYVQHNYNGILTFETDMFNLVDGKYCWNLERSQEAIRIIDSFVDTVINSPNKPDFCLCGVFGSIASFDNHIVKCYNKGYKIYIKTLKTQYKCIHDVPAGVVQKMREHFTPDEEVKKYFESKNINIFFNEMPDLDWKFREENSCYNAKE